MTKTKSFVAISCLSFLSAALAAQAAVPSAPGQAAVEIREIKPFAYVCAPYKGPFTDMGKAIGVLMQNMQAQNLFPPLGPLFGVYYASPKDKKPEERTWEVGFPIAAQANPLKPLEKKSWNHTTVAVAMHVGPYAKTGETIDKILGWLASHGYEATGPVMERYLNMDPSGVKEEKLKTEVWIPCRNKAP